MEYTTFSEQGVRCYIEKQSGMLRQDYGYQIVKKDRNETGVVSISSRGGSTYQPIYMHKVKEDPCTYELDIIEFYTDDGVRKRAVVSYSETLCCFVAVENEKKVVPLFSIRKYSVIGNLYQNAALLASEAPKTASEDVTTISVAAENDRWKYKVEEGNKSIIKSGTLEGKPERWTILYAFVSSLFSIDTSKGIRVKTNSKEFCDTLNNGDILSLIEKAQRMFTGQERGCYTKLLLDAPALSITAEML